MMLTVEGNVLLANAIIVLKAKGIETVALETLRHYGKAVQTYLSEYEIETEFDIDDAKLSKSADFKMLADGIFGTSMDIKELRLKYQMPLSLCEYRAYNNEEAVNVLLEKEGDYNAKK